MREHLRFLGRGLPLLKEDFFMIQSWEVSKDKGRHFKSQNWVLVWISLLQTIENHILTEELTVRLFLSHQ